MNATLLKTSVLVFVALAYAPHAQAEFYKANWEKSSDWSKATEDEYSAYVSEHYKYDFFSSRNLITDCADAAISLRNVFAYERGYPLVYKSAVNTGKLNVKTSGTKSEIKQFFANMRVAVSTRTIWADSYPVKIHKDTLKPGAFFLMPAFHTLPVQAVDEDGTIHLLASTVPPEVRELDASVFSESEISLYHPEYRLGVDKGGFRHFYRLSRDPSGNWIYVADPERKNVKGSAEDQFTHGGIDLSEFVGNMIAQSYGQVIKPADQRVDDLITNLETLLRDRVDAVCVGASVCGGHAPTETGLCSYRPEGMHSTPGRDERASGFISKILTITRGHSTNEGDPAGPDPTLRKVLARDPIDVGCNGQSRPVEFYKLFYGFKNWLRSSDPVEAVPNRWGLDSLPKTQEEFEEDWMYSASGYMGGE